MSGRVTANLLKDKIIFYFVKANELMLFYRGWSSGGRVNGILALTQEESKVSRQYGVEERLEAAKA